MGGEDYVCINIMYGCVLEEEIGSRGFRIAGCCELPHVSSWNLGLLEEW